MLKDIALLLLLETVMSRPVSSGHCGVGCLMHAQRHSVIIVMVFGVLVFIMFCRKSPLCCIS